MEDSGFERIIDDEETGEMFKDAYMQEAIVDKVRAVEFDLETISTAEVGSLFEAVVEDTNGFERIADEDEPMAETVNQRLIPDSLKIDAVKIVVAKSHKLRKQRSNP